MWEICSIVNRRLAWVAVCLGAPLLAVGCGGGESYQPVTGRITLDGQPLADADISFMPEGDKGIPSFGRTDEGGVYVLRQTQKLSGAPVGEYRVRISTYSEGRNDPDDPQPKIPERVPAKYNLKSELMRQIGPGENHFDFDLQSQPGR